ncbi:DUF3422 family protein [Lacisediminimonas sp.]|uniref:DUF3422 family protein n=1 Tax=Lacisediminimonas sp. TaxID=3060582 RepID=UPI00271F147C|nr:DUF3422 domain-containing protein [Lacisediminimonas sp.]MDO8300529.1 DUF3422 domain-containing protein [Lacisediminimonas sp.]
MARPCGIVAAVIPSCIVNSITSPSAALLPANAVLRTTLHDEVHARPSVRIDLPALVVFVTVLNEGVDRAAECEHLRLLPGQGGLTQADLQQNFVRLRLGGSTLRWERHGEFTRYVLLQESAARLPEPGDAGSLRACLPVDPGWLAAIPGRTIAAIELTMLTGDLSDPQAALATAQQWFDAGTVVASLLGNGHSLAVTDFHLRPDGFERIVVIAKPDTSAARAGRVAQRLLDLETYRLMSLRGLPSAKELLPILAQSEAALADITAQLEARTSSEDELLDTLIHVAAGVERATAQHAYRFSATQAYDALVRQRIVEMREAPVPGTQTIGEFLQRRLSPAMATVAATSQRLSSLSQRIERTSALLRTRVDIATEKQNHQLLAKLTRGQELQLRLQATVEGLSIAAISYYVVSLLLYAAKSLKALGLPLQPEVAAGALIPVVLFGVWRLTRRIHARLH